MIETGLKDKVVIVTGAAAGIGRATAERFVAEGCKVAAWDVNRAPESAGVFQEVNVANAGEVEAAVADVVDRWGSVFVLINNAGILRDAQLVKFKDGEVVSRMTDEAWDAVIGVNLKGVFNCTRAVAPHLIAGGGGVISHTVYGRIPTGQFVATGAYGDTVIITVTY